MRRWLNVTILSLAVGAGGPDVCRGELRYLLTDLGALGMTGVEDINECGAVVGGHWIYDGKELIDVGGIFSGPSSISNVLGLNDLGEAVGRAAGGTVASRVTYYDGEKLHDLGELGGTYAIAEDINNRGQIIGIISVPLEGVRGFVLRGAELTTFESLVSGRSDPKAINDAGQVVGQAKFDHGDSRGFLYDGAELIDLGTLGGDTSAAWAINDVGQIVGSAELWNGRLHACLWDDGTIVDLGTLGGDSSHARAINDLGIIVGDSYTSDGQRHMFLYDGTTMLDLNELIVNIDGWEGIDVPKAINNAAQIVGEAKFNGDRRPYLLAPVDLVPEPHVLTLLAAAGVTWWVAVRWRRKKKEA